MHICAFTVTCIVHLIGTRCYNPFVSFILSCVWTTCPKTSCFVNKCNCDCIAFFYFGQSFLFRYSSTFCGSGSSSFCMMSKVTWKILKKQYHFNPIFHLYAHNILRSHYFQVPIPLQGLLVHFIHLWWFFVNYIPL